MTFLGAYVVPHYRPVWSGGMVRLLGEFGFSISAARVALARVLRHAFPTARRGAPSPCWRRAIGASSRWGAGSPSTTGAVALFDRLYAALAGPAQRHFDEVTTAP
jgi:DNA-binding transcriptional regulator PaaX